MKKLKEVVKGVVVGIATTGLTSCGGGSDPAPPPAECSSVNLGQQLIATGSLAGTVLTITIAQSGDAGYGVYESPDSWLSASVLAVTGASLVKVTVSGPTVTVVLRLAPAAEGGLSLDASTPESGSADAAPRDAGPVDATIDGSPIAARHGSFTFAGTLSGPFAGNQSTCAVQRTFDFTVGAGGTTVSEALPLRAQQHAEIAVLEQHGEEMLLEARTAFCGAYRAEWTVSNGEILETERNRMRWRLPRSRGVHQVEVLLDFGEDGFALDVRRFTVS